jgi:NAD(P)-dependent dehydrogenase (short-subunit alcohol dehydrogenase family)
VDTSDRSGATMLVTGGNTGIGLETVIGLARTGARVVFTSRSVVKGREALGHIVSRSGNDRVEMRELDLASFASIRDFAAQFLEHHDRLDVLVNNAGLAPAGHRWETAEGFEAAFGVNHLGHFLLTSLLLERIVASAPARIVVVSSGAHAVASGGLCFDDLQHEREFHSMRVYGESKLANIYFARELARHLAGTGVTVNALNPGYVATELGQIRPEDKAVAARPPQPAANPASRRLVDPLPPPMTPADGAKTTLLLALAPELADLTGAYFSECRKVSLGAVASDDGAARRLWEISDALIAQAAGTGT